MSNPIILPPSAGDGSSRMARAHPAAPNAKRSNAPRDGAPSRPASPAHRRRGRLVASPVLPEPRLLPSSSASESRSPAPLGGQAGLARVVGILPSPLGLENPAQGGTALPGPSSSSVAPSFSLLPTKLYFV